MKKTAWLSGSLGVLLSISAGPLLAAQASEAKIRELMDAVGVAKMFSQMNSQMVGVMQQQLPCVPASYWQGFIDANGTDQLISRMVPVYQKHFTAEDIDGLLKFYKSPLGQKVIVEMPLAVAEGAQLSQQWGKDRGLEMIATLQKQGTLNTEGKCPSTAPASSSSAAPAPAASTAAPAATTPKSKTTTKKKKKKH